MRGILSIGAIGVAFLAGCGAMQPSPPAPGPTPGPTAAASAARSVDLAAIVPGTTDTPGGLRFDYSAVGAETLTMVVISGRDAAFAALPGFVDGRAMAFSGSGGVLLTIALAFDLGAQADAANQLYQDELRSIEGYGFGEGEAAGFGTDGVCDTGPNPALGGLEESICIWRTGRVVFLVGGTLPMATIRSICSELHDGATRAEA